MTTSANVWTYNFNTYNRSTHPDTTLNPLKTAEQRTVIQQYGVWYTGR